MFRKFLATVMTAAVFSASLVSFSVVLPGCGGDDVRQLPGGQVPEPTDEERATLKGDPTRK